MNPTAVDWLLHKDFSGRAWMPAPQSGSPMTYMVNGKQYIVVAISGGNYSGECLTFRLPEAQTTTTSGAARREQPR